MRRRLDDFLSQSELNCSIFRIYCTYIHTLLYCECTLNKAVSYIRYYKKFQIFHILSRRNKSI